MLLTDPVVFAVKDRYQISAAVTGDCFFRVKVGDRIFSDHANGVMRCDCRYHRVEVPMALLDEAGEYTVITRTVRDRKPYFPDVAEPAEKTYSFRPLPENPRIYCISDAHNQVQNPIDAAADFGSIDLLVLLGDVADCAYNMDFYNTVYRIAGAVSGGRIPVVIARGNHDLRGYRAEHYGELFPIPDGHTYYTFRLGSLWGIVLDAAEDKPDNFDEYNGTVCCAEFRQEETRWLAEVMDRPETEYDAPGVRTRLVICHHPFLHRLEPPFDIETDTYALWGKLLSKARPELFLAGHLHTVEFHPTGDGWCDLYDLCPVAESGVPERTGNRWTGLGVEVSPEAFHVIFNCSDGTTVREAVVERKPS